MRTKLKCIMLIDDNAHDNFFHERAIKDCDERDVVVIKNSGLAALDYIRSQTIPILDLIFLDINMPEMNAWEFLQAYGLLDTAIRSQTVIIMLSTSANPTDLAKAKRCEFVSDYIIKPLTGEKMKIIAEKYFV